MPVPILRPITSPRGKSEPDFRTKLQIAADLAAQAQAAGLDFRAVAADCAYGDPDSFRSDLYAVGLSFVMALKPRHGTWAYGQLLHWCAQWPERRFAVEGTGGLGRSLAQQLAAAGEDVVDVPSTLSARARLLATGGDRKTDPADALHVAQVAVFRTDLRKVTAEDQSTILRLLTERHDDLTS